MGADWTDLIDTDHYQPFWERVTKDLPDSGAYEMKLSVQYWIGTASSDQLREFMEENADPRRYPQVMVISYMDEDQVSYGYMRVEELTASRI